MNCILTSAFSLSHWNIWSLALFMLITEVIVFFIVQFGNFYIEVCEYILAFLRPALVYWKKYANWKWAWRVLFCILYKESIAEYNYSYPSREQKILVSVTSAWGQTYKYRIWVVQTPGAASLCDLNCYFLLTSHFCNLQSYSAQGNLKTW